MVALVCQTQDVNPVIYPQSRVNHGWGARNNVRAVDKIPSGVWLYDWWWGHALHTTVKNMVSSCETTNCPPPPPPNQPCLIRNCHSLFLFPLLLTFHCYTYLPHSTTSKLYCYMPLVLFVVFYTMILPRLIFVIFQCLKCQI